MTYMEDAQRISEIIAELELIKNTKNAILYGGQKYDFDSGSSKRGVENVDYDTLVKREKELRAELRELDGQTGMNIGAGW